MATLSLADGTLWYETTGSGPTLVFVHGGWLNGLSWTPQVDRFADDHRVVTLDLRGHGRTGTTDADRYSVDLFTDDLETLLAHLDVDRPVLCGLSLGSMVVQEFLHRHPDGAAGAILAGAIRSMPPVGLPSSVKPFVSPLPALVTTLSATGPRTVFRSMLLSIRQSTGGPWLSVDPTVRAEAVDAVGDISRAEFRKIFGALYRYDPPAFEDVIAPVLVIQGDREPSPIERHGRSIVSAVDEGRLLTLPDAGHLVNLDRPRAFNDAAAGFLADR